VSRKLKNDHHRHDRILQQESIICSCSPRSFTVTLDLLQSCLDNSVESNAGILSPTECTIEAGDPDTPVRKLEDILSLIGTPENRNEYDGKYSNGNVDKVELNNANIQKDQNSNIIRRLQVQDEEQSTSTPTAITSITFIELNSLGTVINVDDQYTNGNFDNGSSISLTSISSTLSANIPIENQMELVPTTQVLFMEGVNAAGEEVRGRFVWNYTNSCASDAIGIQQGDDLAWVQFTEVEEQLGAICPASGGDDGVVPTIAPTITPEQTGNPTVILPTATPSSVVEEEGTSSPILPPTQSPLETMGPTDLPSLVTIDTIQPTSMSTSLDPTTVVPTSLEPTPPTVIDTVVPTSAKPTRTPIKSIIMSMSMSMQTLESSIDNILDHFGVIHVGYNRKLQGNLHSSTPVENKSIMSMPMSMQHYYVSPQQRTESSIENILDHFDDVIHVGYNRKLQDNNSNTEVESKPTSSSSMDSTTSVKEHFEVIHIGDIDDNNIMHPSKSHKPVMSKSGKKEKSSYTSSTDDDHTNNNSIVHFISRSRYSRSGDTGTVTGTGTGTEKRVQNSSSDGGKGGRSSSTPIGHNKSGKIGKGSSSSGIRGAGRSW